MLKSSFALLFLILFTGIGSLRAMNIEYNLRMPKPQNHYFEVEMIVSDLKGSELDVKMPVWAPGSYLVREFAKNVNLVKAFDENGNALSVHKTTKNTWNIQREAITIHRNMT